jgi:hypothetical protein
MPMTSMGLEVMQQLVMAFVSPMLNSTPPLRLTLISRRSIFQEFVLLFRRTSRFTIQDVGSSDFEHSALRSIISTTSDVSTPDALVELLSTISDVIRHRRKASCDVARSRRTLSRCVLDAYGQSTMPVALLDFVISMGPTGMGQQLSLCFWRVRSNRG